MKKISYAASFCLILFTNFLNAQTSNDKAIHLSNPELSIEIILNEMKQQAGVEFSYNSRLPIKQKIKFINSEQKISILLKAIKQATNFSFQWQGNKVIFLAPGKKSSSKKVTVSGYLIDASSKENLIGGNIYTLPDVQGTVTNTYGYYSLTLPPTDSLKLVGSYAGYKSFVFSFPFQKDTIINIGLSSEVLEEVVVTSDENMTLSESVQMSTFSIPIQKLKALPVLAGESDVMKNLQLLPGISGGTEGSSGIYVRGGSPDQNLILLDGVPVYNASHLFGFFSVFNGDAINHVELTKGGFPARYGGRLSSVVDISMKEGDQQSVKGQGSIGLIASRFTIEGPLKKNKSSFIISARRTYIDVLAKPFIKKQGGYFFYDLNAKINYHLNNKNRIFLSTYTGEDKGYISSSGRSSSPDGAFVTNNSEAALRWGNVTTALRWNSVITPRLFSNVTATYSRYLFRTSSKDETVMQSSPTDPEIVTSLKALYSSGIKDYTLKADFDFIANTNHYMRFGIYGIRHSFNPGALVFKSDQEETQLNTAPVHSIEWGAYLEDEIEITSRLKINPGLHFSGYGVQGTPFSFLQPRFSSRYSFSNKISMKASYARMNQYIHLLTNSGIGLPTDLWVPATARIKPQQSEQIAVGFTYTPNSQYEFSIESYYKTMNGVIEYKDGATYLNTKNDWQEKIETGKGKSYGAELFIQKKTGKWTGWLGYTLSRSNRQFDNLNFGKIFPYRYDRRHDLELTASRTLGKSVDFSFAWVYGTGNAISLPVASYERVPENFIQPGSGSNTSLNSSTYYYEGRNSFRLRAYHRLDVSFAFKKTKKWGERSWIFGLYNAYSRRNPFYVDIVDEQQFSGTYTGNGKKKLYQYSLFPIIPSVSYNFKF